MGYELFIASQPGPPVSVAMMPHFLLCKAPVEDCKDDTPPFISYYNNEAY